MKSSTFSKWPFISAFLLLFLLLSPGASSAQSKIFYWDRFDVDITLLNNGDLRIVESMTLNFTGLPFTNGFRGIPVGNSGNNDGITDISVSENGVAFERSSSQQSNTFDVNRETGEEVVRWYFSPTSGRHTYLISYTVLGAVRLAPDGEEGEGDQIFWKPTPTDLPARIDSSTVVIHLPEGVRPQQYTGTNDYLVAAYIDGSEQNGVRISVSDDGRNITYDAAGGIIPGEVFEVRVQFPHGLLQIETSDWQSREQKGDVVGLIVLVISLLILVGGPLSVLVLWYNKGRDPQLGIVVPNYISEPPDNLPPGVVGTLIDEKVDMRDIISTLVDLSRRGYMTIEEQKRNHTFKRTEKSDGDLRGYERKFLTDLFGNRKSRSLNGLKYKFAEKLPGLRKEMYEELKLEDLAPSSPQTVRYAYGALSGALLLLAIGSFFAVPFILGGTLGTFVGTAVCPSMALGLTAIALFIASRAMPVKSKKGTEASAKWDAFKEYLSNAEQYGDLAEASEIFEQYLAYAIAFGLERTWIRKFNSIPTTPIPTWYGPYYGTGHSAGRSVRRSSTSGVPGQAPSLEGMSGSLTGGLDSMSKGLTRMLNSASSVMKSTPPSSGSGGSSGGFSGGFSGGSSGGGGSAGFG